ncbi:MAG TPA: SDR family oxidoreductase [Acidobacteriota bacterium]|jgi:3-oxoacyl-[acyl-carrier protein] reductase|nr:SDR family oxidoreductase [Acidobacteriota bacterium]
MSKLLGKVALVSGSGRGIGESIACKLASEGARVVVNDLDEEPALETVARIRDAGGEAIACVGNVTEPDFGTRFVAAAVDAYDGLDIIVNNAGYTWDGVIQKMTDEQWEAILEVHLTAPFRILRAAAEYIRPTAKTEAASGEEVFRKVVNISSIAGTGGGAGQANYSTAKAGILGLTRAMAKEWGRYKVNVNAVAFGLISTRLTKPWGDDDAHIEIEGRTIKAGANRQLLDAAPQFIPLGRPGTPEEAAGAVYLLCTPEANYITGQLVICGGGLV